MKYHCAEVAALRNLSRRTEAVCAAAIFALGFALRLAALAALPAGLNQDEASALYDAWAILNYGVDRNMNALPVLLVSWGSGQNALLSYLAMPFIALLGPTVLALRLPVALSGCLTLVFFRALARRAAPRAPRAAGQSPARIRPRRRPPQSAGISSATPPPPRNDTPF